MELILSEGQFAWGAGFLIDRLGPIGSIRARGNAVSPLDGPPSKLCAALDMSRDRVWTDAGEFLLAPGPI
jgi:hypothetical protein